MAKFIRDIRDNYRKMERELVTQLSYEVEHNVTMGTNREEVWVEFFRRIIPKKFNIARSVFIIDSSGNRSNEVDIAIYDEQYTPYIFNHGVIKFIPIEAVAAVVQCKSKSLVGGELTQWVDSVTKLKTSTKSVVRLANWVHIGEDTGRESKGGNSYNSTIQTGTTPIKILCHIKPEETDKSDTGGRKNFDIVIEAFESKKSEDVGDKKYGGNLKITFNGNESLYDVLCHYNRGNEDYDDKNSVKEKLEKIKLSSYEVKVNNEGYSLLSFIFQFNQMLMMINNPMFFPHKAYVDMFMENGR